MVRRKERMEKINGKNNLKFESEKYKQIKGCGTEKLSQPVKIMP